MNVTRTNLPDSNTLRGRVLKVMIEEGGRWTGNGLAQVISEDPIKVSEAMYQMRTRGILNVVATRKRTEGVAGRREYVYEVSSVYVAAYSEKHRA